jgi:Ca2+/Na+ antiporter
MEQLIKYLAIAFIIFFFIKSFVNDCISNVQLIILVILIVVVLYVLFNMKTNCKQNQNEAYQAIKERLEDEQFPPYQETDTSIKSSEKTIEESRAIPLCSTFYEYAFLPFV